MKTEKSENRVNDKLLVRVSGGEIDPDAKRRNLVMGELETIGLQSARLIISDVGKKAELDGVVDEFENCINRCDWTGVKACCAKLLTCCTDRYISTSENRAVIGVIEACVNKVLSCL